ncbi:MAG TPA: hypothetical protein VH186_00255 [Chloroflexia bacterium]|nr:hypothetical protein [Chloroflexia bacterium]
MRQMKASNPLAEQPGTAKTPPEKPAGQVNPDEELDDAALARVAGGTGASAQTLSADEADALFGKRNRAS